MIGIVLVVIALVVSLYRYRHLYIVDERIRKLADAIPGPKGYPIIGNAGLVLGMMNAQIEEVNAKHNIYGDIFSGFLGTNFKILTRSADDAEVILNGNKEKAKIYTLMEPMFGNGLLTAGVTLWEKHRKILNRWFNKRTLIESVEKASSETTKLVEILNSKEINKDLNILPPVRKCTLDILCKSAMGLETGFKDENYFKAINRVGASSFAVAGKLVLPKTFFNLTEKGKKFNECVKIINDATNNVLQEKKELNHSTGTRGTSFVDLILSEGSLTDEEIRNEVQTFLLAGHETTALTISFCLHSFSKYPDIQETAYNEIEEVFGQDGKVSFELLSKLEYLESVIKETLRMYPIVPFLGRILENDVLLPSGYLLPKGTEAFINVHSIHYSSEHYSDPYEFKPEHFSAENIKSRHKFAFLPFGGGPRTCIGYKYAMVEMKAMICTILRNFKVLPSEKPLLTERRFVIVPTKGIPVQLVPRNLG